MASTKKLAFFGAKHAILEAKKKHNCTLVFLHGLGDQGTSWAPAFRELQSTLPGLRVVCPTAPLQPVTINGGMRMPSWHDIKRLDKIDGEKFEGLDTSISHIHALLREEAEKLGGATDRIILGGFSQGGGVSSRGGYTFDGTLAGVVICSGYLPYSGEAHFKTVIHEANKATPALVCHGTADQVVAPKAGRRCAETLQEAEVPCELKTYPGLGHGACNQEMADIFEFIVSRVGE